MAIDLSQRARPEPKPPAVGGGNDGRDSLLLRALSIALLLALLLAVAVAIPITRGASGGGGELPLVLLTAFLVLLFIATLAAMNVWARRQHRNVERLAEATRLIAAGEYGSAIDTAGLSGETAELGHALEDLRHSILRQRELFGRYQNLTAEILDGLGEGLLAINHEKRVVLANRRFAEIFHLSSSPAGRSFVEVLRSAPLVAAFDAALRGEEASEEITVDIAGARKQIEIRAFPMREKLDLAAVAIFIDVTRLEQLERVRRDFVADFSHEARTPLAGIRSAFETLESGPLDPGEEAHLRTIMVRQLNRLETLVQEVGELKQIESGEVQLDRRDVELSQMLRSLCDDASTRNRGGAVRIELAGEPSTASVDPLKIEQVFTNLIDNAIKYGGPGGEVRVEVRDQPEHAIVRVIDFGEGIPEEEHERIFQRFYRVDRSRSGAGSGTGLGLAIAKHLVLLHGGTIRVESQPGKGAAFEVRLPKTAA